MGERIWTERGRKGHTIESIDSDGNDRRVEASHGIDTAGDITDVRVADITKLTTDQHRRVRRGCHFCGKYWDISCRGRSVGYLGCESGNRFGADFRFHLTNITGTIAIAVELIEIGDRRTVVDIVRNTVTIGIDYGVGLARSGSDRASIIGVGRAHIDIIGNTVAVGVDDFTGSTIRGCGIVFLERLDRLLGLLGFRSNVLRDITPLLSRRSRGIGWCRRCLGVISRNDCIVLTILCQHNRRSSDISHDQRACQWSRQSQKHKE